MDFNIDNESFAAAYKCLSSANELLENGLGNFNELDNSALVLINKGNVNNNNRLNNINRDCYELRDKMYRTIEYLSKINAESAYYFMDILAEEFADLDFANNKKDVEITSYDAVSKDNIKYRVDVIGEVNENTRVILMNHGGGGSYKELDSYLENEDIVKGNAIIIRYPRDGKTEKSYRLMEEVSQKYNIPIQNCTTVGFSAGGKYAIKQMADLVAEHPEIKQPVVMLVDAYEASSKVTTDELEALGSSGAILFSVQREGVDQEYINHDLWSNQYGINFVKISDNQCKNNVDPHNAVLTGYFENGGFDYQAGNGGFRVETLSNRKGELYASYEQPRFYNSETGKWELFDNNNEILNSKNPTISLSTNDILFADGNEIGKKLEGLDNSQMYFNENLNLQPKNNTLIAHRGYSPGGITDNSRESFTLAGQSGYWGCETDVRFDRNGNLVCSHNSVATDENPILFDEYLDICKEYGMTPVIDLKYENGTEVLDPNLSTSILQTLYNKGMINSSVLQTNNAKDVAYIRENSNDARIWYLKDAISDSDVELIQQNNVECVNIKSSEDKNMYRIKNLSNNGVDVCVWNVQSEHYKNVLLKNGAKYVMTDYSLGVKPYEDGDVNYNLNYTNQNKQTSPVISLSTDTSQLFDDKSNMNVESPEMSDLKNISLSVSVDNDTVSNHHSKVPLFYQSDYTDVNYGTGTLATHGCGIASLSMVASYYNDTDILPDELARKYRGYGSSSGTDHSIFEKTADELNLPFREHVHYGTGEDLQTVVSALKEGCVVVAKAKKNSIFTESGHYIVLTGVTEDGKIMVNDPNKYNYKEFSERPGANSVEGEILIDGFENGFDQEVFKYGKVDDFFIYSPKSNS